MTLSGLGSPTACRVSETRRFVSFFPVPRCLLATSPIWCPTVNTGLKLVPGLWKTMLIRPPRIERSSRRESPSRSRPSKLIRPVARALSGSIRRTERPGQRLAAAGLPDDTDGLADADGRGSPRGARARSRRPSREKSTRRSSISSSALTGCPTSGRGRPEGRRRAG